MQLSRILLALMLFITPSGARSQSPEEPCSVSADPSWTSQEKFVWERVCVGEDADFNEEPGYRGHLDPMKADDWPWTRELRPKFLTTILLKDPYRGALTRKGVVIVGARFTEDIDLDDAELEHPFALGDSLIEKDANLRAVRSKFPIIFTGSNVAGTLQMSGLVGGEIWFMGGHFTDVNLTGAHVGVLAISDSKVTGELDMISFQVDRALMMSDAEFAMVNLGGAHVGVLNLSGSKVSGELFMNNLHVDGDLLMANHAEFADVNLGRAHVGTLSLQGSKVTGKLNMNIIKVDSGLFMNNQAEFAEVDLTGAHVGSDLDLRRSKVTGKLIVNGLQVGNNLFMRNKAEFAEVDLTGAHVGSDLDLRGSKVTGNVNCDGLEVEQQVFMGAEFDGRINCLIAKIKGDLNLSYGQFKQDFDLSGTRIDGSLNLSNHQRAQWADGVTLVLRDAKVLGTIPALTDAWAPKLDLDGFTYRSVGKADQFKDWFGRLDHYARQPYDQLASTVQSQGNGAQATAIRYSSRERERSEATRGAWVWLTILKWVIGYGYYPYWAAYWAIALVIMGALVLRVSGEGPRNGMPYGFAYSMDTLLPIIRLREKHSQIDLQSWPRYYFYGHKIMGYVLGFFLIAGITGLTK